MKKFFSSENPYRDLIYISTAVIFILGIVLYKSSLSVNTSAEVELSESADSAVVTKASETSNDSQEKTLGKIK